MKTLLVKAMIVASAIFNLQANACMPPIQDVIKYRAFGGMPGPTGPMNVELTLKSHNVMVLTQTTGWGETAQVETKEMEVTLEEMDEIYSNVALISGGDLTEPTQPPCMDAPTIEYSVFKNGQEIKIHRIEQCRELALKDESQRPAAEAIQNVLDAYLRIAFKR